MHPYMEARPCFYHHDHCLLSTIDLPAAMLDFLRCSLASNHPYSWHHPETVSNLAPSMQEETIRPFLLWMFDHQPNSTKAMSLATCSLLPTDAASSLPPLLQLHDSQIANLASDTHSLFPTLHCVFLLFPQI